MNRVTFRFDGCEAIVCALFLVALPIHVAPGQTRTLREIDLLVSQPLALCEVYFYISQPLTVLEVPLGVAFGQALAAFDIDDAVGQP